MNGNKTTDILEKIYKQNQIIISLLARLVFPEEKIKSILTKNSKRPEQMVKAYNLCNGTLTTNEIVKKLTGITGVALNKATLKWEKSGIITNLGERGKGKKVMPLHLYKLSDSKEGGFSDD